MLGRDKAKPGLGLPTPGAALSRLTTWFSSGKIGHIAGPGPQDYLGIPPVQTVGTYRRPKMRAGPQPS